MTEQNPPDAPRVPDAPPRNDATGMFREVAHLRELIEARMNAHGREHALLTAAVEKAEAAVSARLEGMNELRAQINTERGSYATREMLEAQTAALGARVAALERAGLVTRQDLDARLAGPEAHVDEMDLKASSAVARLEALVQNVSSLSSLSSVNAARIEAIERNNANLAGRFAVVGTVVAFVIALVTIGASVLINTLTRGAGGS